MPKRKIEKFRTLYLDPGEDFGWCVGQDLTLLAAGTGKMWHVADEIWDLIENPANPDNIFNWTEHAREGVELSTAPVGRIVCEDFRIYPWKAKDLKWDRVRTARVIGAITFMCRLKGVEFVLQGANIKAAAQAAGAEELYYRPLRENRHQNDAIQHFVFYTNVEMLEIPLPIPDGYNEDDEVYH